MQVIIECKLYGFICTLISSNIWLRVGREDVLDGVLQVDKIRDIRRLGFFYRNWYLPSNLSYLVFELFSLFIHPLNNHGSLLPLFLQLKQVHWVLQLMFFLDCGWDPFFKFIFPSLNGWRGGLFSLFQPIDETLFYVLVELKSLIPHS